MIILFFSPFAGNWDWDWDPGGGRTLGIHKYVKRGGILAVIMAGSKSKDKG